MEVDLKITHLSNPTWQPQAHERWTPTIHCTPTTVKRVQIGHLLSEALLTDLCDIKISWILDFKSQNNTYFSKRFLLNIFLKEGLKYKKICDFFSIYKTL